MSDIKFTAMLRPEALSAGCMLMRSCLEGVSLVLGYKENNVFRIAKHGDFEGTESQWLSGVMRTNNLINEDFAKEILSALIPEWKYQTAEGYALIESGSAEERGKAIRYRYGISPLRYEQIQGVYCGEIDDPEMKRLVEMWGSDTIERGYIISEYDNTEMYEVTQIDDVCAFEDDDEAARKAAADGVSIIPEEELPENFDRWYFGWIDTPENRKAIEAYCRDYQ